MRLKIACILVILLIGLNIPANATSLASSQVSTNKIFKCQPSTIDTLFNDAGPITGVYVNLTPANGMPMESYPMVNLIGGIYEYVYGNDATLNWGNKTISYYVIGTTTFVNTTTDYIFVYSDTCTGTGISNVSLGFGHYTNQLNMNNASLMNVAIMPYTDYFGSFFYLIVLLILCMVLYLKTQHIMTPLIYGILGAILIIANLTLPDTYMNIIKILGAAIIAAILWKIFKS